MNRSSRQRGFTLLEMCVVVAVLVIVASLVLIKTETIRSDADDIATRALLNTVREAFMGSAAGPGYLADMQHVPDFAPNAIQVRDLLNPEAYPEYDEYRPEEKRGWRGPYLDNVQPVRNTNTARNGQFPASDERRFEGDTTFLERHFYEDAGTSFYGEADDRAAADPWGNPIVVQVPPAGSFTNVPVEERAEKRKEYTRIVSAGADGILQTSRDDPFAGRLPDGTTEDRGDDLVIYLRRADINQTNVP